MRIALTLIGLLIFITLVGCAKYPATPPVTGKQLVITFKVRGKISPIDDVDPSIRRYYFVAIDNDGDDNTGPWAVTGGPYGGNGWSTSADAASSVGMTSFIRYDAGYPGYLFQVLPGSYFLNTSGPLPLIQSDLLAGGTTLRFVVDFSQIATAAIPADEIKSLNINFITTDSLPIGVPVDPSRQWDALGPSGQNYIFPLDTTQDGFYSGDSSDFAGTADADLDIIYWSVEVQTVSSH